MLLVEYLSAKVDHAKVFQMEIFVLCTNHYAKKCLLNK